MWGLLHRGLMRWVNKRSRINREEVEEKTRKAQRGSTVTNHSQSLLKMETKVYIKEYQGDINALNLN